MGRGGVAQSPGQGQMRADVENSKLLKENAQLKVRNQELNDIVMKLTTEREAQKETLREKHLQAVHDWRTKYTKLEEYHKEFKTEAAATEMRMQKTINELTEKLDEATKLNADLDWKLKKAEDDLAATRLLAKAAVEHQFKMLSGMFKVYQIKSLTIGFHHWEQVMEKAKQQREIDTLKLQIKILNLGAGVRVLEQIFKRWRNKEMYGGWATMSRNFHEQYAEWKMSQQLAGMNAALKAEALRKLNGILNIWAGKACAKEMWNMISSFKYDKRIAHIAAQADRKLKKLRKWRGFGEWIHYLNEAKERKHWQEFEDMKNQIKDLKDELAKSEAEIQKLMEKYLGARHSAFFDKIDRIMKAWRFGTFGLAFSDWTRWAKDEKKFRLENAGKASREELMAELAEAKAEIATLNKRIALLEAEKVENAKGLLARDEEIAMLKERVRSLEAKTATLYDQGFSDGNKDKEEALGKLMEKFLLTAQGAFLDKVNEILKAWQFGSYGYMFSSWKSYVNAEKRPLEDTTQKISLLEDKLKEANQKIALLEAKLEAAELAAEKTTLEHNKKIQSLQDKIDKLEDALASAEAATKAAEEKAKKELEYQDEQMKKKTAELKQEVKEAEAEEEKAEKATEQALAELNVVKKELAAMTKNFNDKEEELSDEKQQNARELGTVQSLLKKRDDKIKVQNETIETNEKVRREIKDAQVDLVQENQKLSTQLIKMQQAIEEERQEADQLRETVRKAGVSEAAAAAAEKKLKEVSDQNSASQIKLLEKEAKEKEAADKAAKEAEAKKKKADAPP